MVSCYCIYCYSYCEASVTVFERHEWTRIGTWHSFITAVLGTLMGVDFMEPVIGRNASFWTLSNVEIFDFDADDSVVDPYSRCGRIVPMYTFFKTFSAARRWVIASFLSKASLLIAFISVLLMCVIQIYLLLKVIPQYIALSVCCSSVSSNIIFMGCD